MMRWLREFFSALVPAITVALASGICAGVLCGVNVALASSVSVLFQKGLTEGLAELFSLILIMLVYGFYLAFTVSFLPNLVGVLLLFLSFDYRDYWLMRLSKRSLYIFGGAYGMAVCMVSFMAIAIKQWTLGEVQFAMLGTLILSPAAILSGIITFRMIIYMWRYKFPPNEPS